MNKLYASLFLLASITIRCAQNNATAQPPKIIYGEDMCEECKMIINEQRFASAIVTQKNTYRFDDIGCMFVFISKHPEIKPLKVWVNDFKSEEWIDGQNAVFVASKNVMTPMGYGILAFNDATEVQRYNTLKGKKILTFVDLKNNPPKEMVRAGGIKE